jgi:hypothetical protein
MGVDVVKGATYEKITPGGARKVRKVIWMTGKEPFHEVKFVDELGRPAITEYRNFWRWCQGAEMIHP